MRWLLFVLVACSAPPNRATPRDAIPIVDSHVHLAYYPVAAQLAQHGVSAVVDLASPERTLDTKYPIKVIRSGPMLTRLGGYPLDSWGIDGYGIECDEPSCIRAAIRRLRDHGASVIKLALDDNGLSSVLAIEATTYAHELHLKVVAHALTDKSAGFAAHIGVDVLAHTPVEPLSQSTIDAWAHKGGAVISTLAAFGGSEAAIDNLRRLRAAAVTVLYGTDLGNLRVDGVSGEEIALLKRAGLDDAAVTAAMTTVPWQFWGFDSR
jgi:hypothetical protein